MWVMTAFTNTANRHKTRVIVHVLQLRGHPLAQLLASTVSWGGSVSKQRLFETQQIARGSTMSAIFWVCLTDFFDVYNCYQLLTMSDFLSTNVQIGSGFPGCKLAPSPHGLSTSAKVMDLPRDWDYSWLDPHRYSHSIIQEWYSLWLGYIVKCILKFAFGQCSNRCTLDRFR